MTTFGEADLAQLMERLNQLVYESSATPRYATFSSLYPIRQGVELVYVNAGHNPPSLTEGCGWLGHVRAAEGGWLLVAARTI